MKKKLPKLVKLALLITCFWTTGCSRTSFSENEQTSNAATTSEQQTNPAAEADDINSAEKIPMKEIFPLEDTSLSNAFAKQLPNGVDPPYEMRTYKQAQNEISSVHIEYPVFFNTDKNDELNTLILKTVQDHATLDPRYFPHDSKYDFYYHGKVTLQTSDIISMVFWGISDIECSAFPTYNLFTLNIDLKSLDIISLTDLYKLDDNFKNIFFEKSIYPSVPVTFFEYDDFLYYLNSMTDKYQMMNVFDFPNTISFFLVPEGIVLSLLSGHSMGDHFEAELLYRDAQSSYIGKYNFNMD